MYSVLDTNVYRGLSDGDLALIQKQERQSSVVALTCTGVTLELLASVADVTSPTFMSSWRALRRLAVHCTSYDGSMHVLRTVLPIRQQLLVAVLGRIPDAIREEFDLLGRIVGEVIERPNAEDLHDLSPLLDHTRQIVTHREQQFQDALFHGIVRHVIPGATTWDAIARDTAAKRGLLAALTGYDLVRLAAEAIVDSVADASTPINAISRSLLIDSLVTDFRVPLSLHANAIVSVVRDGTNMNKGQNANTIWDIEIAASVSANVRIRGVPTLLVTNDRAILNASQELALEKTFVTPDAYRRQLETRDFLDVRT